jgi:hypothetical protein
VDDREVSEEVAQPTPGEHLIYVLGQLYRRWHAGRGRTSPSEVDIESLARVLGVWPEVEFACEDGRGNVLRLHFPTEVLVIERDRDFPWRLLNIWEWALEQEQEAMRERLDRWA